MNNTLPSHEEMLRAFQARDRAYDGVFFTGVRTTGIFCRPGCPARTPLAANVEFFPSARDALFSGYRPCLRCRPMESAGAPPADLAALLERVERDPARRWQAQDLRGMGLHPDRVRRWFQQHFGMTFHAYSRSRRLGGALKAIREGDAVTQTAYEAGFESLSGFSEAVRRATGEAPSRAGERRVVQLRRLVTPLGPMLAGAVEEGVCLLEFAERRMLERQLRTLARRLDALLLPGNNRWLDQLAEQVEAYFGGAAGEFHVPLVLPGTDFQQRVWEELQRIPAGATISYGELAARIGQPTASRAVARANGDNRVAILVPCHRVIGVDGKLTGYGGGMWRKQKLLDLERGHDSLL